MKHSDPDNDDYIEDLKNQIEELEDRISNLESDNDELDDRLDHFKTDLKEQEDLVKERNEQIEHKNFIIHSITEYYENDIEDYYSRYIENLVQNKIREEFYFIITNDEHKLIDYFTSIDVRISLRSCLINCFENILDDTVHLPQNIIVDDTQSSYSDNITNNNTIIHRNFFLNLMKLYVDKVYELIFLQLYCLLNTKDKNKANEDKNKSNVLQFLYELQADCALRTFKNLMNNNYVTQLIRNRASNFASTSALNRDPVSYNEKDLTILYEYTLRDILVYCCNNPHIHEEFYLLVHDYFINNKRIHQKEALDLIKENIITGTSLLFLKLCDDSKENRIFSLYDLNLNKGLRSYNLCSNINTTLGTDFNINKAFVTYNLSHCTYYYNLEKLLNSGQHIMNELIDYINFKNNIEDVLYEPPINYNTHNDLNNKFLETFKKNVEDEDRDHMLKFIQNYILKVFYLKCATMEPTSIEWKEERLRKEKYICIVKKQYNNKQPRVIYSKLENTTMFINVLKTFLGTEFKNILTDSDHTLYSSMKKHMEENDDKYEMLREMLYNDVIKRTKYFLDISLDSTQQFVNREDSLINLDPQIEIETMKYNLYAVNMFLDLLYDNNDNPLNDYEKRLNKLKLHL